MRPRSDAYLDHPRTRKGGDQVPEVRRHIPAATSQCLHVSDIEKILILNESVPILSRVASAARSYRRLEIRLLEGGGGCGSGPWANPTPTRGRAEGRIGMRVAGG